VAQIQLKQLAQSGASDQQIAQYDSASGQWQPADAPTSTALLTCDSGVAVRDVVYLDGSGVAQKADASSISTAPAVGLVLDKPTSTSCNVMAYGLMTGFSGLTIGQLYMSETAGSVTSTAPAGAGRVFQPVGRAVSATVVLVQIGTHVERGT
jgi:hypothetical protein